KTTFLTIISYTITYVVLNMTPLMYHFYQDPKHIVDFCYAKNLRWPLRVAFYFKPSLANTVTDSGRASYFVLYANKKDIETINVFLNTNTVDKKYLNRALHKAVNYNDLNFVKLLIEN